MQKRPHFLRYKSPPKILRLFLLHVRLLHFTPNHIRALDPSPLPGWIRNALALPPSFRPQLQHRCQLQTGLQNLRRAPGYGVLAKAPPAFDAQLVPPPRHRCSPLRFLPV